MNKKTILALVFIATLSFDNFLPFVFEIKEATAQNSGEAKLFLSPSTGSFLVGSTFEVSIIVDTDDALINTVKADLDFPADKLQIVTPSSGKSFISIWLEQPAYSNIQGTISFSGGIPEGLKASSGIVSTVTLRVIKAGEAIIKILPSSSILAHDGKGTEILAMVINGRYVLKSRPPEGPRVFSETHSDETQWCNNNNPIVSWEKESGVTDFSFILNSYPQTVPDNTSDGRETTKSYENLADGLWYFHIKAKKAGVWGAPSHFLLRIDTIPPASFKPEIEFLLAAIIGRAFVSFFTTDALSGIDHYEIAVIDKEELPLEAPVFIEAESPYQLPKLISGNLRVTVRAIDNAGNVKDEHVNANYSPTILSILKNNILIALLVIMILITGYLLYRLRSKLGIFNRLKSAQKVFNHFNRSRKSNRQKNSEK